MSDKGRLARRGGHSEEHKARERGKKPLLDQISQAQGVLMLLGQPWDLFIVVESHIVVVRRETPGVLDKGGQGLAAPQWPLHASHFGIAGCETGWGRSSKAAWPTREVIV